jgi:predicted nucleic acid-binding protein
MKVLLDVNVVLDVLLQRQPWLNDAQSIWDAAVHGHLDCCLAASSLTDIYYISRKLVGPVQAKSIIGACLDALTLLPVDHDIARLAAARPEADFEDAVQVVIAAVNGVDALVTRDERGFAQAPIPVWTPADLALHVREAAP